MTRTVSVAALALLAVLPLVAQTPKGWRLRADRGMSASDPDAAGAIKFVAMGSGFHATNPQATVFWNPANTVTGNYSLKGTFTLMKPSGPVEYYGLVVGGSDLEGAEQNYLYFMVAQDRTWLIKRRDGNATREVSAKTAGDLVKKRRQRKVHQYPRSAREGGQDRVPRQRYGRTHDAQDRPDGEDRRQLWHPGQSPPRCSWGRVRGREAVTCSPRATEAASESRCLRWVANT